MGNAAARVALLGQALWGRGLSESEVRRLADQSAELVLMTGQVLVEAGDPFTEWYVVMEGCFAIHDGGNEGRGMEVGDVLDPRPDHRWPFAVVAIGSGTVLAMADLSDSVR